MAGMLINFIHKDNMNFYQICDDFLQNLAQVIEDKDTNSSLEIDYLDGILKITINNNNKTFIINRNSGNQKIWYSSPFTGADYFTYDEKTNIWYNSRNIELTNKILSELKDYI